eukprot:6798273-Prorocentrum_lima.AAC.1
MRVGRMQQGVIQALTNLPVRVRQCEGGWEIAGVDPHLLNRLLTKRHGDNWCTHRRILHRPCT